MCILCLSGSKNRQGELCIRVDGNVMARLATGKAVRNTLGVSRKKGGAAKPFSSAYFSLISMS